MSDFVEQCRREWERLGVPGPVAEEMATDLATDLREAEAEGISVEELLGSSAFDPRSFAASWAAERGVVPARSDEPSRRRPVGLIAFTAVAAIAVVVAAALLLSGEPKVSVVTTRTAHFRVPPAVLPPPPGAGRQVLSASAATPVEWILLLLAIVALGFAAWLWSGWARSRPTDVAF